MLRNKQQITSTIMEFVFLFSTMVRIRKWSRLSARVWVCARSASAVACVCVCVFGRCVAVSVGACTLSGFRCVHIFIIRFTSFRSFLFFPFRFRGAGVRHEMPARDVLCVRTCVLAFVRVRHQSKEEIRSKWIRVSRTPCTVPTRHRRIYIRGTRGTSRIILMLPKWNS